MGTNQEVKELFEENAELKQQLAEQQAHYEHEMEQSLKKSQLLREDMRSQHEEYQKKIVQAENGYKVWSVLCLSVCVCVCVYVCVCVCVCEQVRHGI